MKTEFTLEELATAVQEWCDEHRIFPVNGQASTEISERTIRYYRTIGLLDAPLGSYAKTFSEKHRWQLIAIRVYQAQGIPLRKIREELYGQSAEALEEFVKQLARKGKATAPLSIPFMAPSVTENWSVSPLSQDFMLVSREGRHLPRVAIEKIDRIIRSVHPLASPKNEVSKN